MTGPVGDKGTVWQVAPAARPAGDTITLDPARALRALRRQWMLIGGAALIGGVIALLNGIGTVPRYESTVTILLDQERSELLQQVSALPIAVVTDAAIQSEMEIIRSRALALAVVDALSLDQDAGFMDPPTDATAKIATALRALVSPFVGGSVPAATDPDQDTTDPAQIARNAAATILLSQIEVARIDRSFVMRVTSTGFDPQQTTAIARAYGEAYTRFQLAGTTEIAINASNWIRERLDTMESRNIEAATAVQRFRIENNLLQVRGDLLSEQQQSELASALVRAATETAALRAELDSYQGLLTASASDMAAVAAMQGDVDSTSPLVDLRREYLETRRNLLRVTVQAGEDHPHVARLRTAMAALESDIALALEGTVAAVNTRYTIARSREASLRQELAAITQSGVETQTVGQLAQLEAIAQTYALVYADYLRRYETTLQQQGFPIASMQIISDAEVPRAPSSPRKLRMLMFGLLTGGLLGLLLAALREMRTAPLRTAAEVSAQSGLPCAGLVPMGIRAQGNTAGNTAAERVAVRTATRLRQEIDRKAPLAKGRIVGLAAVDVGGDVDAVVAALCTAMVARAGRVSLIDAGGLETGATGAGAGAARKQFLAIDGVEIGTLDVMRKALYDRDARRPGGDALSDWHERWPYTLIVLAPLTRAPITDQVSNILDATVLSITWGRVPAPFLIHALRDHPDFRAGLATTVLDSADLQRARRYMDRNDYEARLIHA